uniref:Uncharacterized protein n=2 Tax=Hemiselmis andersenii TaxID=464988 RepID=A0A6U4PZ83_HEMAN|mmetsp:Transcript_14581/g.35512  ORF Transcript_14581/g.35512 Transcript_14581/m.35512 type:complete len:256 (+) Transcript_14581:31-798(+)|eukprot:CAMPEP_0169429450 /NCGR_PEP_ID=MMETSP1042-20121227/1872_1 /TAXON_ID=464988 /ORGANISM="Hemiselmis andersenii, Strain CCMP1180" /LENGTH=255 /DNA_ID=CAMNT_0009539699 /DNA_START=231 /DNA_END=998 /DNA_ORIENTATION=-
MEGENNAASSHMAARVPPGSSASAMRQRAALGRGQVSVEDGELGVQVFVQQMQHARQELLNARGHAAADRDGEGVEAEVANGVHGEGLGAIAGFECPSGADAGVWQLENIRHFTMELSGLAVALNSECTSVTCPKMKATDEWMYLCAAHKQPQECSAMDYIIHTLDGTCSLLTSAKWFPSRSHIPDSSLKYFQSIARRLYRILSHTFFHHRATFDAFENKHQLCCRFVAFAKFFDLIPPKLLIIPETAFDPSSQE